MEAKTRLGGRPELSRRLTGSLTACVLACTVLVASIRPWAFDKRPDRATDGPESLLCQLEVQWSSYQDGTAKREAYCIPANYNDNAIIALPHFPMRILDEHPNEFLIHHQLLVEITQASIVDGVLSESPHSVYEVVADHPRPTHRNLVATTGTKRVAFVRIITPRDSPTASLDDLRAMVGSSGVTAATQYAACSQNQLQLRLHDAVSVQVSRNPATPMQAALEAESILAERFGLSSITDWGADWILFCVPPSLSRSGWTASGTFSWRSIYSNDYCRSLGAIIHETGHALGLSHSWRGNTEYGDISGYMGYTTSTSSTSPRKCFNAAKLWQLGWYSRQSRTIAPSSPATVIDLKALVNAGNDDVALVQIGSRHYLSYNFAEGFNSGTELFAYEVALYSRESDKTSKALAGLFENDRFSIADFEGSGQRLVICVCSMTNSAPWRASVSIGYNGDSCKSNDSIYKNLPAPEMNEVETTFPTMLDERNPPQSTPPPTRSPTRRPTPRPTPIPTRRPSPNPTRRPTPYPTPNPTRWPTPDPTWRPTPLSSVFATPEPTEALTLSPTKFPTPDTPSPTRWDATPYPTPEPTWIPDFEDTLSPTLLPTENYTDPNSTSLLANSTWQLLNATESPNSTEYATSEPSDTTVATPYPTREPADSSSVESTEGFSTPSPTGPQSARYSSPSPTVSPTLESFPDPQRYPTPNPSLITDDATLFPTVSSAERQYRLKQMVRDAFEQMP